MSPLLSLKTFFLISFVVAIRGARGLRVSVTHPVWLHLRFVPFSLTKREPATSGIAGLKRPIPEKRRCQILPLTAQKENKNLIRLHLLHYIHKPDCKAKKEKGKRSSNGNKSPPSISKTGRRWDDDTRLRADPRYDCSKEGSREKKKKKKTTSGICRASKKEQRSIHEIFQKA